jgi:hypothetical protein
MGHACTPSKHRLRMLWPRAPFMQVDWYEFRAYMAEHYWTVSKDAHTILTQAMKGDEDMIMVGGRST